MRSGQLRVLAVAAPHWIRRVSGMTSRTLNSRTPFSLQNAVRLAASAAQAGTGAWGESNWHNKTDLATDVVMYEYADDLESLQERLELIKPNLLLIGAMTLALPGAVEIARRAKALLGDAVTVVLGGKHATETIYHRDGEILHAPGSALRIMAEGKIPPWFDLVVSGDGEHLIVRIGELVAAYGTASAVRSHIERLSDCPGSWIAGGFAQGVLHTLKSANRLVDYSSMPVPTELFGFEGSFPVFGTSRTGHAYSDTSRGCSLDCSYCSERRTINGTPQTQQAADRLARHLDAIRQSGKARGDTVSAWIEDSILLMGNTRELDRLRAILSASETIPFGGQVTMDLLHHAKIRASLASLVPQGLSYLYAGMETADEAVATTIHKNTGSGSWMTRSEGAVEVATLMGVKFGISVMFGLGESHAARLQQLRTIGEWQVRYSGNPRVVSLNLATQHPLLDVGHDDYLAWGTPADSPRLALFQQLFGEASERYPMSSPLPTVAEMLEISAAYQELNLQQ